MDITRLQVGKTLSEAAIHNGTIYLAGQIAEDFTQDISGQTREVLGHIDRLLAAAGSNKSRILMCQIFIADMKHFPAMNEVWNEWIVGVQAPPRATVEAKLAHPEWLWSDQTCWRPDVRSDSAGQHGCSNDELCRSD